MIVLSPDDPRFFVRAANDAAKRHLIQATHAGFLEDVGKISIAVTTGLERQHGDFVVTAPNTLSRFGIYDHLRRRAYVP